MIGQFEWSVGKLPKYKKTNIVDFKPIKMEVESDVPPSPTVTPTNSTSSNALLEKLQINDSSIPLITSPLTTPEGEDEEEEPGNLSLQDYYTIAIMADMIDSPTLDSKLCTL